MSHDIKVTCLSASFADKALGLNLVRGKHKWFLAGDLKPSVVSRLRELEQLSILRLEQGYLMTRQSPPGRPGPKMRRDFPTQGSRTTLAPAPRVATKVKKAPPAPQPTVVAALDRMGDRLVDAMQKFFGMQTSQDDQFQELSLAQQEMLHLHQKMLREALETVRRQNEQIQAQNQQILALLSRPQVPQVVPQAVEVPYQETSTKPKKKVVETQSVYIPSHVVRDDVGDVSVDVESEDLDCDSFDDAVAGLKGLRQTTRSSDE